MRANPPPGCSSCRLTSVSQNCSSAASPITAQGAITNVCPSPAYIRVPGVYLRALAVHGVLGQRLEVLPAVQSADPAERGVVHLQVAAVTLAEDRTLHVRGLELAAHGDQVTLAGD